MSRPLTVDEYEQRVAQVFAKICADAEEAEDQAESEYAKRIHRARKGAIHEAAQELSFRPYARLDNRVALETRYIHWRKAG